MSEYITKDPKPLNVIQGKPQEIEYEENEHGTLASVHKCATCGGRFTVVPAIMPGQPGWEDCLAPTCKSYDPTRDADKFFGEDGNLKEGIMLEQSPIDKPKA